MHTGISVIHVCIRGVILIPIWIQGLCILRKAQQQRDGNKGNGRCDDDGNGNVSTMMVMDSMVAMAIKGTMVTAINSAMATQRQ